MMPRKRLLMTFIVLVIVALQAFCTIKFPAFWIFIVFFPLALLSVYTRSKSWRNVFISILVVAWLSLFTYETFRGFQLTHIFKDKNLAKTKFLFPPAGWIMFYRIGKSGGFYEVYGLKDNRPQLIDSHDIFRTRTIGYDNLHRGILGSAANRRRAQDFCRFLRFRFPYFDEFVVSGAYLPNPAKNPYGRTDSIQYRCVK